MKAVSSEKTLMDHQTTWCLMFRKVYSRIKLILNPFLSRHWQTTSSRRFRKWLGNSWRNRRSRLDSRRRFGSRPYCRAQQAAFKRWNQGLQSWNRQRILCSWSCQGIRKSVGKRGQIRYRPTKTWRLGKCRCWCSALRKGKISWFMRKLTKISYSILIFSKLFSGTRLESNERSSRNVRRSVALAGPESLWFQKERRRQIEQVLETKKQSVTYY